MDEAYRDAVVASLANTTTAHLCEAYVKLRDHKKAREDELAQKLATTKLVMELIENQLLAALQADNVDSVVTPHGTAYRKTLVNYSVKDKAAFMQWAEDNDIKHVLDVRAAKAAVDEVVAELGEVPPGLNRSAIFKIGIRRSTNK